jgi:hypothetical protein
VNGAVSLKECAKKDYARSVRLIRRTKMEEMPNCPECEKLEKVAEESNDIGQFIEWLLEHEYQICTYSEMDGDGEYVAAHTSIEELLASYFKIDLKKVEQERRALLDWVRNSSKVP